MGWGCPKHEMDDGSAKWDYLNEVLGEMVNPPNAKAIRPCPACLLAIVRQTSPGPVDERVAAHEILDDAGIPNGPLTERIERLINVFNEVVEISEKLDNLDLETLLRLLKKMQLSVSKAFQ